MVCKELHTLISLQIYSISLENSTFIHHCCQERGSKQDFAMSFTILRLF